MAVDRRVLPRHPLIDDPRAARDFVETIRFDGARAVLHHCSPSLILGERGTSIVLGLMNAGDADLAKAERILGWTWPWEGTGRRSVLTADVDAARNFVAGVRSFDRPVTLQLGQQSVRLNLRAQGLLTALLLASPKRAARAVEAAGVEATHGWGEGLV